MDINIEKYIEKIRVIESDRNYWFIRSYGGAIFPDFIESGYVGIGFNKVPLKHIKEANENKENFNKLKEFIENNTEYENGEATKWANQLVRFYHKVKKDDLIITPSQDSHTFKIGVVKSDVYLVDDKRTFEHKNNFKRYPEKRRKVDWKVEVSKSQIQRDLIGITSTHQAITDVNKYADGLESFISEIYIRQDGAYLTLRVEQDEDINAYAFRDF